MRWVDRSTVPVPASLATDAARSEFAKAGKMISLRSARLARHARAVAKAQANGVDPPKLPRPHRDEASFAFKLYKAPDIRAGLETLFHGKCAYCETRYAHQAPVDIEHYRPKGAVEDDKDHPGYWWLAARWENLVPSCIDCNRRRTQTVAVGLATFADFAAALRAQPPQNILAGKKDAFPIAGMRARKDQDDLQAEQPYFLNPTIDKAEDYLDYYLDHAHDGRQPLALILPKLRPVGHLDRHPQSPPGEPGPSIRGLMTIQFCGLNRLALVQERTAVLRRLEFLRETLFQIDAAAKSLQECRATAPADLKDKLKKPAAMLEGLVVRLVDELTATADPRQPYSTLARRWLDRWAAKLAATLPPAPPIPPLDP